jgi:membrane-associated phospholipid phosphatase
VRLAPLDRATLVYLCVAFAFTLARGPRRFPAGPLLPSALVAAGVLAAWLAPRARRAGGFGQLLAEFYPLLLTLALYRHVGLVNDAARVGHDALVQGWEQALFGAQASLVWIRAFPSPAWSTLMHAAYLSFYLILAASTLGLWLAKRREAARATVFALAVTFYLCYMAFLLFPVAGPRYSFPLAANRATAVPMAVLAQRVLERGSAWGTAFPSSHVAAALVAAVCAWRAWRPLGAVLLPISILLSLATVYCQFHYAVDALAGAALAGLLLLALPRPASALS